MLNYFFVLTQMHMHYWTIRMTIFRSQTVLGCQRLIELCCETEPPTLSTERISHWFPCRGCERLTCCAWILSPHRSPANALYLNFDTQPSRSQQSVSLNWLNRRGKHLPSSWCIHWSRWIHPATRDTHTSSVFPTESLFHSVCAWLWVCVCVCVSSRFRIADKLKETLVWSSLKVRVNTSCRETFSDSSRTLNEKQPRLHNKFARASTVQLVVLSVPRQNKNVSPTRKMGLKRLNAGVKSIERWMYQVLIANYVTIPQLSSAFFCGSGCFMGFHGLLSSVWQRRFQLRMDRNEDDDLAGLS